MACMSCDATSNLSRIKPKAGIRIVPSANYSSSNMWLGPAQYNGNIWPTLEHAIVGVKCEKWSFLVIDKIPAIVVEYCPTSYKAKQFGKDLSHSTTYSPLASGMEEVCALDSVLIHKSYNSNMIYHPHNVIFLGLPSTGSHGHLLGEVCETIILIAKHLHYYLHHSCVVKGVPHIYLGPHMSPDDLQ